MKPDWNKWKQSLLLLIFSALSLPLLAISAFFIYLFFTGPTNPLNGWLFERDLPEYSQVVADIKASKNMGINHKLAFYRPTKMPGRAIAIQAARCNHGTAVVEFLVGGSAIGHWGYIFDDCDIRTISPMRSNRNFSAVRIHGDWYEFSD